MNVKKHTFREINKKEEIKKIEQYTNNYLIHNQTHRQYKWLFFFIYIYIFCFFHILLSLVGLPIALKKTSESHHNI